MKNKSSKIIIVVSVFLFAGIVALGMNLRESKLVERAAADSCKLEPVEVALAKANLGRSAFLDCHR